MPEQVPSGE